MQRLSLPGDLTQTQSTPSIMKINGTKSLNNYSIFFKNAQIFKKTRIRRLINLPFAWEIAQVALFKKLPCLCVLKGWTKIKVLNIVVSPEKKIGDYMMGNTDLSHGCGSFVNTCLCRFVMNIVFLHTKNTLIKFCKPPNVSWY